MDETNQVAQVVSVAYRVVADALGIVEFDQSRRPIRASCINLRSRLFRPFRFRVSGWTSRVFKLVQCLQSIFYRARIHQPLGVEQEPLDFPVKHQK
ncbi:hypothetical protein MIH18_12960 [Marinobacter sp. M3C]|uniref:hypothetical protein n=1 Tax=Marinobacter sp. M3C TaxID=2917715 RepID=UPI00200F8FE1|nr:hypothetical protein [Marinobacter sp. M3C]MCL1486027.1 hypothetical protein [Marinobacter sp.]UQG58669.1 hypothetical protein MIH18_12960 [Marinobacter sp. M3C]